MPGSTPVGPQYYDEVDMIRLSSAVMGDTIYVYCEVVGTFETGAEATDYGTEEVETRVVNIGLDLNPQEGVDSDIYTRDLQISYYLFLNSEQAGYITSISGETLVNYPDSEDYIHAGGSGTNYIVMSAPTEVVSFLGVPITPEMTVAINAWAESASTNYHHFAFDRLLQDEEEYLDTVLGGE